MATRKVDFTVVQDIGAALPDVDVSMSYGGPALKIRGKLLACAAQHKSAEPGSLVVQIGFDERARLLAESPEIYYLTEHYVSYPSVLVRLARISRRALGELLGSAWVYVSTSAPTRARAPRPRVDKTRARVPARRARRGPGGGKSP